MEKIFLIAGFTLFFIVNARIIYTDIQEKKIPNKLLLILLLGLPFWYILAFYTEFFTSIDFGVFFLHIFITLTVSFALFSMGMWGAGDAKYLLVLCLYIPHIGVLPLLGNIAIVTLLYLLGYFLYFWVGANIRSDTRKNLKKNIYADISQFFEEKKKIFKNSKLEIVLSIFYILLIFVCVRLFRIILTSTLIHEKILPLGILEKFPEAFLMGLFLLTVILVISGRALRRFFYNITSKKVGISDSQGKIYFLIAACSVFSIFLVYEYLKFPEKTLEEIWRIITLYFFIFISIKLLLYMYKKSFLEANVILKPLSRLKVGEIVDYSSLVKKWGESTTLGYISYDQRKIKEITGLLSPSPSDFFKTLKGGISSDQIKTLKKAFKILGEKEVPVCSVFSYGVYIFGGFLITIVWGNTILSTIVSQAMEFVFSR